MYSPYDRWDAYPKPKYNDSWFNHSWYWNVGWGLAGVTVVTLGFWFIKTATFADWMWPHTNADNNVQVFNADEVDDETPPPPATNDGTTGSGIASTTGNRVNAGSGIRDIRRSRGIVGGLIEGVSNGLSTVKSYLNPLNYYTTSAVRDAHFKAFMNLQNNYNTANRNYYPFTSFFFIYYINKKGEEVNPYASWSERLSLTIFGESTTDAHDRQVALNWANSEIKNMLRPNIGHSADDAERFHAGTSVIQYEAANTTVWTDGNIAALPEIVRVDSATEIINSLPSTPKLYPSKLGSGIPWDSKVLVSKDWDEYLATRNTLTNDEILKEREEYYKQNPDNVGKNKIKNAVISLNNTTKAELLKNTAPHIINTKAELMKNTAPPIINTATNPEPSTSNISSEPKVNVNGNHKQKGLTDYFKVIENQRTKLKNDLPKLDNLGDVVNLNEDAPLADGSQKRSSTPVMDAINKHLANVNDKTKH